MSDTLRTAAQQALEALESLQGGCTDSGDGTVEAITVWCPEVIDALRAALAGAEGGGNLPPPLQVPTEVAEVNGTPSAEYIEAAKAVQAWIAERSSAPKEAP